MPFPAWIVFSPAPPKIQSWPSPPVIEVAAVAGHDPVVRAGGAVEDVVAVAAVHLAVAASADDVVAAVAAMDDVVARAAVDQVARAAAAVDRVVARAGVDRVSPGRAAVDGVAAVAAVDRVAAVAAVDVHEDVNARGLDGVRPMTGGDIDLAHARVGLGNAVQRGGHVAACGVLGEGQRVAAAGADQGVERAVAVLENAAQGRGRVVDLGLRKLAVAIEPGDVELARGQPVEAAVVEKRMHGTAAGQVGRVADVDRAHEVARLDAVGRLVNADAEGRGVRAADGVGHCQASVLVHVEAAQREAGRGRGGELHQPDGVGQDRGRGVGQELNDERAMGRKSAQVVPGVVCGLVVGRGKLLVHRRGNADHAIVLVDDLVLRRGGGGWLRRPGRIYLIIRGRVEAIKRPGRFVARAAVGRVDPLRAVEGRARRGVIGPSAGLLPRKLVGVGA